VKFELVRLDLRFRARNTIAFAEGKSANTLRGFFGYRLGQPSYGEVFAPRARGGPSGLADLPRPFVFRAACLDGRRFSAGEEFAFAIHLFDGGEAIRESFLKVFREWERAELAGHGKQKISLSLDPAAAVSSIRVRFVTPTELKSGGAIAPRPEFEVLFRRARDRIATLACVYGAGPLPIDFRGLGERARNVRLTAFDLRFVEIKRRSSRTGQVHPLGGMVGTADYEGELGECLPWLEAASWTGVGRQTVWGKGEIRLEARNAA
jgi:hypothetical protein